MGFYAYCVVMAVGCLLWWWGVAVVVRWRVWVCGSARWRSEFMDWHGGACGFVDINVCGGVWRQWVVVEVCVRGVIYGCG